MAKCDVYSMLAGLSFRWKLHDFYRHIYKGAEARTKGVRFNTSAHLYKHYLVFQESPCADVQGRWQLTVLV